MSYRNRKPSPRSVARTFSTFGGLAVALPMVLYVALSILSALASINDNALALVHRLGLAWLL